MNFKKTLIAILVLPLLLSGCGKPTSPVANTDTSFVPISALTSEPEDTTPGEGPQRKSLYTAISYDGLTFVPTDRLVSAQADAPDIVTKDGNIYLYYSGWVVGDEINDIAVAISKDQGENWKFYNLEYEGLPEISDPTDPDVLILEDGTFRMYFSASTWTGSAIFYADSEDGIHFTYKGLVGINEDQPLEKSTTAVINDHWYQYALGETVDQIYLFEGNQDALEFTGITSFPPDGVFHKPINGYWLDGKYQMLLIDPETDVMRSMRTTNGRDWYVVDGERMKAPKDSSSIVDATVTELENGTYLMIYSLYQPE